MGDRRFVHTENKEAGIELLKKVIDVLDDFDMQYYLDFGTLIGAIREKGFIPWDDDIDISLVNEADYEKIPQVLKEIRKRYKLRTYLDTFVSSRKKRRQRGKQIFVENVSFTDDSNYQIAKIRTNRVWRFGRGNSCVDIFFKYVHKDESHWVAYGKENSIPLEVMSKEYVKIDFCGLQCSIPKEYDEYLTYKYGDWRTPQEKWTHKNDDFSIKDSKR